MKRVLLSAVVAGAMAAAGGTAMAAQTVVGAMGGAVTAAAPGMMNVAAAQNWYGGPVYSGEPDLPLTAALVQAGGGAEHFSFPNALVAMLGQKTVDAEVAKLEKQYGAAEVKTFLTGMTYAVNNALMRATKQGVKLPPPADLSGPKLAIALVQAGTDPEGTFWAGYLFDHTITHQIHNEVMADIDIHVSEKADATTHRILNQAMYDVAQALHVNDVKLASFH